MGDIFALGTWKLATAAEIRQWGLERMTRRNDPRVYRLFHLMAALPVPDIVVFEDVQFQSYTQQCQLWSSLRAAVWLAFPKNIVECVSVKTLKQFATGNGAATKEAMVRAVVRENPQRFCLMEDATFFDDAQKQRLDDNAADAFHLFRWAEQNLSRKKI